MASVGLDYWGGAKEPSPDLNTTVATATFCFDETILRVIFLFLLHQPSIASRLSLKDDRTRRSPGCGYGK